MKQCPYCNAQISDDSFFCEACGRKLPQEEKCVKCGKSIDNSSDFCPYCGAKQNSSVSTSRESEKPLISPSSVQQSKKSSKVVSVIASSIFALAVLGGAAYYWFEIRKDYSHEGLAKVCSKYNHIGYFHEGLARVVKDSNYGFIDKRGEEVIPFIFDWADSFYDVLALLSYAKTLNQIELKYYCRTSLKINSLIN